jgi:hypothetical protein
MIKYYLFFCFLFFTQVAFSQQSSKKLISIKLQRASIDELVKDVEAQSSYHFFYDVSQFDSLKITLEVTDKTIDDVLTQAFNGTSYKYAITNKQQIFLTKGQEIITTLASGYFGKRTSISPGTGAAPVEYDNKTKPVQEATTENKLYEVGVKTNTIQSGNARLSGYIKDVKTGEALVGASIFVPATRTGVATDQFGYYSITLPKGRHTLNVKGLGMRDSRRQIVLYSDGALNIELQEQITALREVTISAEKIANVRSTELGVTKLDIKSIKQIPAVFGEADILRAILTLPGVQTVGEATTGFNVRGGSADQNLILLNDETIYNPAHFFGFFSAFNPDIVKNVELYKSTIPERFGGRLSSVLEVVNREGNKKNFTGSAGIGLLTSRLNIEGPIAKDRTSFILGGRTTYSNWLLSLLPEEYKHSRAAFSDVNLDISHQSNERNNFYFSGYFSNDNFKLNSDTTYGYSNKNASVKWRHNFNNKLYGVVTLGMDRYENKVSSDADSIRGYKLNFDINQTNFKYNFNYYLNNKHTLNWGINSTYYKLHPGSFQPSGIGSLTIPDVLPAEQALESALFLGDKYDISDALSFSFGLRYSLYNYLGPRTVNNYAPNLPVQSVNFTDSTIYGKNKVINSYHGPEIRVSARYNITDNTSVKAGYNTLRQYLHLLSNTTAISPTDIYKLSDPNIKPQYGDQVSLGLYRNFKSNTIETSIEVYYKRIKDYLDYKSGATLLLNHTIETDVVATNGKAYGVELLLRKTAGQLNGWLSYTYSRTFLKMDNPAFGALINRGEYYPANYDKPHSFNLAGNYRFTQRYSVSLNVTYSTGRPITLPIAKYYYAGSERVYYSDRNAYRIPDYFRSDFSVNIEGNHKLKQRFHNSWTFGVYNLTGRQNAYSTYFVSQAQSIRGYKLSIFANPIPFVNYNIRF